MLNTTGERIIAYLTLCSSLFISSVAIFYSVTGLVSIFAAAAVPVAIMGLALEGSKLVASLWLKHYWHSASTFIRTYLLVSVIILMLITSLGIFGFLSKAHLDQAVPAGDVVEKVAVFDEKIAQQQAIVSDAKRALAQLDTAVDQVMARTTDASGATRSIAIRKSQTKERASLQKDIELALSEISKLKEARAPVAKDLRAIEAEVGPIKYIAALIYGDSADSNMLENAVRWVIILIVLIFDPLAVALLLASQHSFAQLRVAKSSPAHPVDHIDSVVESILDEQIAHSEPEITSLPAHTSKDLESDSQPVVSLDPVDTSVPTVPTIPVVTHTWKQLASKKWHRTGSYTYRNNKLSKDNLKAARRKFKEENPGKTIHELELKKDLGLISNLPWEDQPLERPGDYLV